MVALVLLAALAVTLVLLGMEWLDSAGSVASTATAPIVSLNPGGSG